MPSQVKLLEVQIDERCLYKQPERLGRFIVHHKFEEVVSMQGFEDLDFAALERGLNKYQVSKAFFNSTKKILT